MMKIDDAFMYNMFTEHHWTTNPKPLRAPINIYARNCFFEDELLDKGILSRSESSKGKGREHFLLGSPPRRPVPVITCGRKKVRR